MRYLLVFFLLVSLNSQSQTWKELRTTTSELFGKGDDAGARKNAEAALILAEKEFGKLDSNYATTLNDIAVICISSEHLSRANEALAECLEIRKNIFGKNSTEYALTLHEVSRMKRAQGDYKNSEKILFDAIKIIDSTEGKESAEHTLFYHTLGYLYIQTGEYDKSIAIYENNLAKSRLDSTVNSDKLWDVINNLAGTYNMMGKYYKAEPLLIEAVEIYAAIDENHWKYVISLSNLGTLYSKLGNYEKAEAQFLKAIEIRMKTDGKTSKAYATIISNLAIVYNRMKSYEKAEALFIEAMGIIKETAGEISPAYATAIVNLADFYLSIKKYDKAEPLLIEGLEIRKKTLGEMHPDYANSLKAVASVKVGQGNDSVGIVLTREAIQIYRKTEMLHHPFYTSMLSNMAESFETIRNLDSAEKYYFEMTRISLEGIQSQFSFQSESEKEKYLKTVIRKFEKFHAFVYLRKNTNDTITRSSYDLLLKTKGSLLKSTSALKNSILNGSDTSLIRHYQKWVLLNKKINSLKGQSIEKRKDNLETLQEQANILEKKLIAGSNYLSEYNRLSNSTWKQVRESLTENEAAIEFTHFRKTKDSILYCALILKKGMESPIMIPLFEQKQLTSLFDSIRGSDEEKIRLIYGEKSSKKHKLYDIIWKPMDPYLKNIKKIRISPSGILHKISFAAIENKKGDPLVKSFELDITSTTAWSGDPNFSIASNDTIRLFGGAEFSLTDKTHAPWNFLEGTAEELDHLNKLMGDEHHLPVMYSGATANEEKFRFYAINSSIIHLATHGFFFPDPDVVKETAKITVLKIDTIRFRGGDSDAYHEHFSNKDPMLRSGIVLSGANDYWNGITNDEMNNGILTASEVSTLDLRKVRLTVLSACESGLGDISSTEGVYGLQRAFKMAGSHYLLMSLWKVPDVETAIFMEKFYHYLFKEKNIRVAIRKTQQEMSKKYDPFYWGAFVLMD